jgi:hypothetical protein
MRVNDKLNVSESFGIKHMRVNDKLNVSESFGINGDYK